MAYVIHDVATGDVISAQTTIDQDNQIAANEAAITALDQRVDTLESDVGGITQIETTVGNLQTAVDGKMNEPATEGTAGQVLTTDGQGGASWQSTTIQDGSITKTNLDPSLQETVDDVDTLKQVTFVKRVPVQSWAQGGINVNTGRIISSTICIRSYYIKMNLDPTVVIPDGMKASFRLYTDAVPESYVRAISWQTGTFKIPTDDANYVRIVLAYVDDAAITIENGSDLYFDYEVANRPYSTYRETLIGGTVTENGVASPVCVTAEQRDAYFKSCHTAKMIRGTKITAIDGLAQDDVVTVHCYEENGNFLGSTNDYLHIDEVYSGTHWMYITLTSETAYANNKCIDITVEGERGHRSKRYLSNSTTTIRSFNTSFDVQLPVWDEDVDTVDSNLLQERHFDNATIMLPPNYDPVDEQNAVPLVIYCHGTGGYNPLKTSTNFTLYNDYLRYISNEGYIVADCSGFSDKYIFSESASDQSAVGANNSRFTPVALACYVGLYNYIAKSFNIKKDGCYVFGKSNGGLATTYLGLMRPFPIKAIGSFAGTLSTINSLRYTKGTTIQYYADRLHIDHTFNVSSSRYLYQVETADDIAAINDAYNAYLRHFDPMTMMSGNGEAISEALWQYAYNTLTQDWANVWTLVNEEKKTLSVPMKIWQALDDTDVPIVYSEMFKKMVDNANGICYLRKFPAGCGAHHALDTASGAPRITITPKYGTEVTVPLAYAELVEWFERWK